MYYCSQPCNSVAWGPLWCGGGRHRLESSTIKEWNVSPHIPAKWIINQGHTQRDFQRKEWLLPFPVPLKFFKKDYRHAPSEEEYTDCGAQMENTILLQPQEHPPTRLTLRVTYWLVHSRREWCGSDRQALACFLAWLHLYLVTANSPHTLHREHGHLTWGLSSSSGSSLLKVYRLPQHQSTDAAPNDRS